MMLPLKAPRKFVSKVYNEVSLTLMKSLLISVSENDKNCSTVQDETMLGYFVGCVPSKPSLRTRLGMFGNHMVGIMSIPAP
jgi:hypothetical protein